jgi:hypothetical protein
MHSKQQGAINRYREILESKGYTKKQIATAVKQFTGKLNRGPDGALKKLNEMLFNLFKYISKAMAPITRG